MRQRSIGVEVEFFNVHHERVVQALNLVGITCENRVHGGGMKDVTPHWKLVADRSVTPDETGADREALESEIELGYYERGETVRRGLELVSPILWQKENTLTVRTVLKTLKTLGAAVNETCGLHIHVGVEDLEWYHIRALLWEMAELEDFFDQMSPIHRRENNNKYCKSVRWNHNTGALLNKQEFKEWLDKCTDANMLKAQFGLAKASNHDFDPKYKKLNVKGFFTNKTIEFRHLYGTLDFEVISTWMKMYLNMIDRIKNITLEEA